MIILASVQRLGTVFKSPISCFLHNNVSYTERLRQSATTLKQLTGKVDHIDHLVGSWRSHGHHLTCSTHPQKLTWNVTKSSRCQVNPGPSLIEHLLDVTEQVRSTEGRPWTGLWCIKALTQGLCKVADTRAWLNPLGGATVDRTCPGLPSLIGIWNIWRPGGHLEVFVKFFGQ